MGSVKQFEDLIAWQKARLLTQHVYQITKSGLFAKDFGLSNQIRRAAVSIMANIAEGFERNRVNEFHQYLSTAKASCGELRSHLYVALDVNYLDKSTFNQLLGETLEVSRIIGGLRAAVAKRKAASPVLSTQHSAL